MAKPTRVLPHPLLEEHLLPMLVDIGVWTLTYGLFLNLGPYDDLAFPAAWIVAALAHVVQMTFLVALDFDDTAITIVRPWRRQRVEWTRIAGLIHAEHGSLYRLRRVLKGNEPPEGRYLTAAELRPHAKGPTEDPRRRDPIRGPIRPPAAGTAIRSAASPPGARARRQPGACAGRRHARPS